MSKAETAGDFVGAAAAYQAALDDADLARRRRARSSASAASPGGRASSTSRRSGSRRRAPSRCAQATIEARARVENGLGLVHYGRGEYVQARAALRRRAGSVARSPSLRAKALLNLGIIANIEGDFDGRAERATSRSRAAFQQAGDRAGEALALHNLGMLHADLHNWDERGRRVSRSVSSCARSRAIVRSSRSVLVNRSEVHCARERFDEAIADCDLAISIAEEIGAEVQHGEALRWKGHALVAAGRHAAAESRAARRDFASRSAPT